ncbi:MAG: hypothetical protein LBT03_01790 [Holosporales bacterium]|nr:hypothetical protein [Holosporales bacterium]
MRVLASVLQISAAATFFVLSVYASDAGKDETQPGKTPPSADELNQLPLEKNDVTTEFILGNVNAKKRIVVYISPACLHCAQLLTGDIIPFIKNGSNAETYCIVIKLLPTSAKDVFILNLLSELNVDPEKKFNIYINYMKRVLATLKNIVPTAEQKRKFKGSESDVEMIKYQVIAAKFGFADIQICGAFPDMDAEREKKVMADYRRIITELAEFLEKREVDLPIIVADGKVHSGIKEAAKVYN